MARGEATLLLRIKSLGANVLKKTRQGITDVGKAAFVAGAAIVGFVGASVAAYREQELAVNQLNQSMVNQGIFTAELSKKYQDQAAALQKVTTFGDEQIIAAQAQLQQFVGNREVTEELTRATLDFAAAQGVDLKVAASLVGKAVGTSTNALQRYGVEIDTTASSSEKMTQVIDGMNNKFGGQAAAAASGLGAMKQMSNALGDLSEEIGKKVAPAVAKISRAITAFAQDAGKTKPIIDNMVKAFQFMIKAGAGVKFAFSEMGSVIGTTLAFIGESVSDLMGRRFSEVKENTNLFFEEIKNSALENAETLNAEITAIDDLFNEEAVLKEASHQEQMNLIKSEAAAKQLADDKKAGKLTLKQQAALDKEKKKLDKNLLALGISVNKEKLADTQATLGSIAGLQTSNNKFLAGIGKAAAIADITINTAKGVARAWGLGPILGPILAPIVAVAGAAQIAKVAGVQLAEGGIVQARPGGTLATIGESGQDEAVIPLDDAGGGLGTTINLTVNGGLMGDESSAREFALALDNELLNLRRSKESAAFDEDFV